jgi:hypothetical protein
MPPTLSAGNDEDATDGHGDSSGTNDSKTINVAVNVVAGEDTPASFNLKDIDPNGVLPQLFSKGEALTYELTLDDGTEGGADVIRAFADFGGGSQRLVFTFLLTDDGSGGSLATLTLNDQLDHDPVGDDVEERFLQTDAAAEEFIDFTDLLDIRDADGDVLELEAHLVRYRVYDDIPLFTADISDGLVDFATGDSVTNSLNGSVGTDENDGNNENTDGTKTYTFASFTTGPVLVVDKANGADDIYVVGGLSADGTTVEYRLDIGNDGVFDPGGTLFYDIVLGDQGGAGDYTFTVYEDPPPAFLEFDFEDLPSGQNLHGTIIADKDALDGAGLLLFPKGADLDGDGEFTNASPTSNTSKGGGPVTIGNSNQMFDPGEGHYFVYVVDPDDEAIAGIPRTRPTTPTPSGSRTRSRSAAPRSRSCRSRATSWRRS